MHNRAWWGLGEGGSNPFWLGILGKQPGRPSGGCGIWVGNKEDRQRIFANSVILGNDDLKGNEHMFLPSREYSAKGLSGYTASMLWNQTSLTSYTSSLTYYLRKHCWTSVVPKSLCLEVILVPAFTSCMVGLSFLIYEMGFISVIYFIGLSGGLYEMMHRSTVPVN